MPTPTEWVEKAEQDRSVAVGLRRRKRPVYDAVCFHCQQCAEKYLKALLEHHGARVPKTHDLGQLVTTCAALDPAVAAARPAAGRLTQFAVRFRYPGIAAGETDAVEAIKHMRRIRMVVRKCLGL